MINAEKEIRDLVKVWSVDSTWNLYTEARQHADQLLTRGEAEDVRVRLQSGKFRVKVWNGEQRSAPKKKGSNYD